MCAKKIASVGTLDRPVQVKGRQATLELSSDTVSIHKNGIEFRSPQPFTEWSEMTVSLQSPEDGSQLSCHGVVVACAGNRHAGYHVSMVFTSVTPQAEERLRVMASSPFGLG
jgi:PilZ domain